MIHTAVGLSKEYVKTATKYLHFRNVQLLEKKMLLESNDSIYHDDIFDPIDADLPKGAWSVQADNSGTVARIRSLVWPGYVGFHVGETGVFGGAYFGYGIKNKDLAFMI